MNDEPEFKVGDKVRVLFGKQEIKRGVIWKIAKGYESYLSCCQVIDPVEYNIKGCPNIDIAMSDYHPNSSDWFPFSAPKAQRFINGKMETGIQVLHAPNIHLERKRIGVRLPEVESGEESSKKKSRKKFKKTVDKNKSSGKVNK